jgi:hypothetical protein
MQEWMDDLMQRRWLATTVWVGISCCCFGCGGSAEPVASPATVVHVQASQREPAEVVEDAIEPTEVPEPTEASTLLERLEVEHCKGMTRFRDPFASILHSDTLHEFPITLAPGKCYTVIAVAPEGYDVELTLQLASQALPMAMPTVLLAQGEKHENWSVLGGNGNCYKQVMPVPLASTIGIRSPSSSSFARLLICEK